MRLPFGVDEKGKATAEATFGVAFERHEHIIEKVRANMPERGFGEPGKILKEFDTDEYTDAEFAYACLIVGFANGAVHGDNRTLAEITGLPREIFERIGSMPVL